MAGYRRKQTQYTGPTKAQILRSDRPGWVNVVTPWSQKFVDDIKTSIQPSHRKWNPDAKFWEVQEMHMELLITILQKHFDEVETDLKTDTQVPDNLFKPVFEALKQLPNGQLNKVYLSLAKACHPDAGGNNELMSKVNQAYQEVTK